MRCHLIVARHLPRHLIVGCLAAVAAAPIAACGQAPVEGPDTEPDASPLPGCDDGPPAIEDCFGGQFFADCGGDDAPRLGCTISGQCRWFTGGCVADGYLASACPAEDICCEDGLPYPDGAATRPASVIGLLYGFGLQPWDRDRAMDVDVVVDSSLQRSVTLIRCERDGADVPEAPCEGNITSLSGQVILEDTLYAVLAVPGPSGTAVAIEVDLEAPGGLPRARVCLIPFSSQLSDTCQPDVPVVCAVSGTVTLARIPEPGEAVDELPLTGLVELADGLEIRAGF